MRMDMDLFLQILNITSTSGSEGLLAHFLSERFATNKCSVKLYDVDCECSDDNTHPIRNVMFSWGKPKVVFCTHLDTVPPYIPPTLCTDENGEQMVKGRGSCDAKGQIFAMYNACMELEAAGKTDFGLLLLAGEETGSYGAKSFRNVYPETEYVIVGEPTENKMVSASKGTKSFELTVTGKKFHSGYPQYGENAIERFVAIINKLQATEFPIDETLGETTWNVGKLVSDNPQNIVSDNVTCRIYFRTTFASDEFVVRTMMELNNEYTTVVNRGGDTPSRYTTLEGFETSTVAFGSDAPQLTNFKNKILCGPGTILVAHTADEFIKVSDIRKAVDNYVKMFDILSNNKQ
jgi:acetylornithine deacetylase